MAVQQVGGQGLGLAMSCVSCRPGGPADGQVHHYLGRWHCRTQLWARWAAMYRWCSCWMSKLYCYTIQIAFMQLLTGRDFILWFHLQLKTSVSTPLGRLSVYSWAALQSYSEAQVKWCENSITDIGYLPSGYKTVLCQKVLERWNWAEFDFA